MRLVGQGTHIKQCRLYDLTVINTYTKNRNSMALMIEYTNMRTHIQRQIHKHSTEERSEEVIFCFFS